MNCRYTDEQLKEDVERTIGIRAKDIEKIQFCGLWHIRFRAFGSDFYYYRANSDDTVHLGPVKIYAQNYLQARLSEVNRQ